jgi:hypothetical protein
MESFETVRSNDDGGPPPPVAADDPAGQQGQVLKPWTKPSPHLRSTRGGAGSAAGSTPKKAYRPRKSKHPRPAGKKPDAGRH